MNPLPCLNCQDVYCRYDREQPPCQSIAPDLIAAAATARLTTKISATIAVYKPKPENLSRCLACVLPQVDEVVICGDYDSDMAAISQIANTPAFQHSITPIPIHLVQLPMRNSGYANKINRAMRESNGSLCLTLNDDVFLEPDAVAKLVAVMESDPQIGAVTHLLRYPDQSIQFGGLARPPGAVGFGHIDHRAAQCRYTEPVPQESLCGASVLFRRQAFYEAGAFPENYFLYSEDTDCGLALRQAGWKIMFTPHAVGIHIEHQSTSLSGDVSELCARSNQIFRDRWRWYFERNPDVTKLGTFDYDK